MRPLAPGLLTAIILAIVAAPLHAQGANYWTVKYGPRASLLGGAVIGSVNDVSAAFYNPGGLAMADSLGFALSLNAFERTSTTAERGLVGEDDVSTSQTGFAPSMLGGAIKGPESGNHVFTYSLITRQRVRNSISEVTTEAPTGYQSLVSQFSLTKDALERWIGLSWAYAIRPNFGIGATGFVTMRFDSRATRVAVAGSQAGEGLTATRVREFDYDHYGVVAKFGALLDYESFAAGLTLTAPSVSVYGGGTMVYGDIDVSDQTGGDPPLIAVAAPEGLSAIHRQPLSIGVGLRGGGTIFQFYASAEWFSSLGEYNVIRSGPFDPQSSTGQFEYLVSDERSSVLNWALAVEGRVAETVTTYASYATDYSSSDGSDTNLIVTPWDIQAVSVGVDFRIRGRSLTLGAALGWAHSSSRDLRDFVPGADLDPPLSFEPTPLRYRSFGLVLGFEF
jgi:hypothetical protein